MNSNISLVSITDLPEELREMIYNKLSLNELLNLRLICKKLKQDAGALNRFEFQNALILPNNRLRRFPDIKIRTYNINCLSPVPLYSRVRKTLFTYPDQLKALKIETSRIRNKDYKLLLEECCHHLTELVLEISDQTDDFIVPCITFNNLTDLHLIDRRSKFFEKRNRSFNLTPQNDMYLNIIENISSSSPLISINIDIRRNGTEKHLLELHIRFTHALFVLICKQQCSLSKIQYCFSNTFMGNVGRFEKVIDKFLFDEDRLNKVTSLRYVNIAYFFMNRKFPRDPFFKHLIRQQSGLEHLELRNIGDLLGGDKFVENVISKNSKTLKTLHIEFSNIDAEKEFDGTGLKDCQNLKQLTLMGPVGSRRRDVNVKVKNLKISYSVEELTLDFIDKIN